ncbi:RNA-binding protein [Vagococcus sp. BWB3-3]|uniref:RNA-binding protein n=1 Tax=Vagococcus allomyrinae TaxID=2794353 RepID=A0A940SVY4_9ENTE|nr:RNA-binding protein [Vagococcus allomyrinae]
MNVNVYQHFRKDEHPFVDMIGGWIEQVESQYAPHLTDFLDPRQAFILESIVRSDSELLFSFYGGYESAERRRALIYPDYYQPTVDEYDTVLFEIHYPTKFGKLSHGKILGTLLNIGIRREFFGDIISDGERWQFFVNKEIAHFVEAQLTKIGSFTIRLEEVNYTEVLRPKDSWEIEQTTVSSMRLDTVISSVFNISRQRAKTLVESGKVKVNWVESVRPDFMLALLDIISIRGFGRIQVREINGQTKKEKHRLQIGVLRK